MTEVTAADRGSAVTPLVEWDGSNLTPPGKDKLISGWGVGRAADVTVRGPTDRYALYPGLPDRHHHWYAAAGHSCRPSSKKGHAP